MDRTSTWTLCRNTFSKWNDHEAPRLGAALAFYSVLSLAPLVILVTAIVALVFGHKTAQDQILAQVEDLVGPQGAQTVRGIFASSHQQSSGIVAAVVGLVTLLLGASGVFAELQSALNKIWAAKPPARHGIVEMIRARLFSFGMVLGLGFLLLVSLLLSAGIAAIATFFGGLLPLPSTLLEIGNFILSYVIIALAFAFLFKFVPDVKVGWNDVWVGAFATALLFTVGKTLIGLYLGKAAVGSAYGAAGSLIVVLAWVYYSAQLFYFGAEFTNVYAQQFGSRAIVDGRARARDLRGALH